MDGDNLFQGPAESCLPNPGTAAGAEGLGSQTEDTAGVPVAPAGQAHDSVGGDEAPLGTVLTDAAASLPSGFELRRDGIWQLARSEDGEDLWICAPLEVQARVRDENGLRWGSRISAVDPDGREHLFVLHDDQLDSAIRIRKELRSRGLKVANRKAVAGAIQDLFAEWRPQRRVRLVSGLGWRDAGCQSFVVAGGQAIGGEEVELDPKVASPISDQRVARGSLEDWQSQVAARCVGNPLLVFAVSLAFSGALLEPLGTEGGGAHLRGMSSSGKSTILKAAVSVWGSPRFMQSWRATANGLEAAAASANSALMALDELAEVSPRDVEAAVYMLANGIGKDRARSDGSLRKARSWRTAILSTGELSVAEKMAEARKTSREGVEVRLIDLPADGRRFGAFDELHGSPDAASFAEDLRQATASVYGLAGPRFAEKVMLQMTGADSENFRRVVEKLISGARASLRLDMDHMSQGLVDRILYRLALVAAAGELATRFDITGWPRGTALSAVVEVVRIWGEGCRRPFHRAADEAVGRVRAFLTAHGRTRFLRETGTLACAPGEMAGWADGGHFYILPESWTEIHGEAGANEAARLIDKAGFLRRDGAHMSRRPPRWCRSADGKPVGDRVYQVRASILPSAPNPNSSA